MTKSFTWEFQDAVEFLGTLKVGDLVDVHADGRTTRMTVSRAVHRCDGVFGSYESAQVTVCTVNGYARSVTAQSLVENVTWDPITGRTPDWMRVEMKRVPDRDGVQ